MKQIPDNVKLLWEKYKLPENKIIHVTLVAQVADYFASCYEKKGIKIDRDTLYTASLLHDIDKNIVKLKGEHHPDTAVRILEEEGLNKVSKLVSTHSLHSILDKNNAPQSLEAKLLYLADKMVKYELITVDKRFSLWREENLPPRAQKILELSFPLVKNLEKNIFQQLNISYSNIISSLNS